LVADTVRVIILEREEMGALVAEVLILPVLGLEQLVKVMAADRELVAAVMVLEAEEEQEQSVLLVLPVGVAMVVMDYNIQ
jgi:hypothetical protein